ncbi:DEKNAAC101328 [Brettanomyces naardenensis]|uniref:Zinc transporter n=1 Tax=Brettanomyces naardenensis TaxID=13370 RepID=A0A448YHY2_BRENA|nr:DEKNAAC101328 [Brettanomyces naardenensis]
MDKSIVAVIFSKYQSIVIYLICFVYDLFESLWLSNGFNKSVILGYVLLSIPLTTFLNPFSNETIAKNVRVPDLNISIVFTIGSLIVLFAHEFNDLNFKMLFVALGSLLIWIVSQLDFENIGRIGKSHGVFNTSMFTHDYKLNLFVLNLIMAAVQHVALNMGNDYGSLDDSTTTTMDLVKSNLFDFLLNVLLIIIIKPQDARPVESKEESSASDSQTKEKGVSFVSLLIQLVKYEDSRSIFNFLLLNMSFMFIQILYSFRSKSLSLLSDSLHMFLDCTSLFLGMMASVVAKNNLERPSIMYPFGLARIETLSGFTNGSLLLGIVFGIFNQAVQRIMNPVPLERTTELLVVSILGLLVNLVGIFAFNHGGDAHGHGHSHSHLHMHSVAQDHEDEDEHEHDHGHEHEHAHNHEHNHSHADDSSDEEGESGAIKFKNDNMHGIFLHIMADTLGSVGVVISTLVVKYAGWSIVDPLTSIFIATLILLSSFPLLKSSASNLLLSLEDNSAEKLKQVLDEVRNVPGVKSYSTPRFWPQDDSSSKLVGYLHVQYYRTEDSTSIRHKIVKILEASPILDRCYLQVENEIDDCWCHKKGIFNTDG